MADAMTGMLTTENLLEGDYDTVIVAAPDMSGRLIGKRMTPSKFMEFKDRGVAVSACVFGWDLPQEIGLDVSYVGFHNGWPDFLLIPDLSSLRRAAWLERTAIVMADIVEEHDHSPVAITPRQILKRKIEQFGDKGMRAQVATELEFHLYRESYDQLRQQGYDTRTPSTLIHSDYTVAQVNQWEPFFQRVRTCLDESGLDVEMSQGEWGLGQWEINLTYGDALDMADRHAIFKLALKDLAHQAGLSVTFMPKPNTGEVGSSCHVHVSLVDDDATSSMSSEFPLWSEDAPHHNSDALLHSIGGILARAGDLMAWYAPTVNSYRRTNSSEFAGHGATWGMDNRTVSCRVLGDSPSSKRIEWRVPGSDVNPYLVIAGVLASIRDGLDSEIDPGSQSTGDAYQEQTAPLPRNLGAAGEIFKTSPFIHAQFGQEVVDQYAAAALWEWSCFENVVTEWEHQRYYENI